jgi:hypothetical protein
MGFEPMTTVFERAKTVHALDHAATGIDQYPIENAFTKEPATDASSNWIRKLNVTHWTKLR